MKRPVHVFLLLISLAFVSLSCNKVIEDKKRDLLLQAMTDGQWHIEIFQEGSMAITSRFEGYNFQFFENGTIAGRNQTVNVLGSWTSDIQNYSITSNFPSPPDPLQKLNGTWKVTDAKSDFVVAEMNGSMGKNIMHLRKTQ